MTLQVGANPIIWSNDDFRDLGGDIPLEQCLAEMQLAGYSGSELGHKYPKDPDQLATLLAQYDLELVSGWHSLYLLDEPFEAEQKRYLEHMTLLERLGSRVSIVAECSRRCYHDPNVALKFEAREADVGAQDWDRLARGLEALAQMTHERGLELVYHHHMGTVIQNEKEIDRLMGMTEKTRLLADTGHLAFAGVDPERIFARYCKRIGHVHLKDVRAAVVQRARAERMSFAQAVRNGVFTVPGDGSINYGPLFAILADVHYGGWLVVEAEQDPLRSPPLRYARMGRDFIHKAMGL